MLKVTQPEVIEPGVGALNHSANVYYAFPEALVSGPMQASRTHPGEVRGNAHPSGPGTVIGAPQRCEVV